MDHWYEIWDKESRNLVADFDTEEEALRFVVSSIGSFGPESINSFVLTRESEDDEAPTVVAASSTLADRAWHSQADNGALHVPVHMQIGLSRLGHASIADSRRGITLRFSDTVFQSIRVERAPNAFHLIGAMYNAAV